MKETSNTTITRDSSRTTEPSGPPPHVSSMLFSGKCLYNHDSIARHGSTRPESTIRSGSGFPGTPRFPTAVPSVVHRSGNFGPSVVRGAPYPRLLPAENTTKNHTTSLITTSVSRTRSGKRFNKLEENEEGEISLDATKKEKSKHINKKSKLSQDQYQARSIASMGIVVRLSLYATSTMRIVVRLSLTATA